MIISAKLLRLGTKPEIDFMSDGQPKVKLNLAENQNKNTGTRDEPVWETVDTSWFQMVAFGDAAKAIIDAKLKEGDAIELIKGQHTKVTKEYDGEKKTFHNYTIQEFKKYDKRND